SGPIFGQYDSTTGYLQAPAGGKIQIWTDATSAIVTFADDGSFTATGTAYKPGGGTWTATSDARLKTVDSPYQHGLREITALRPVNFHYRKGNIRNEPSDRAFVGLVAQEVQKVMPEAVKLRGDGYLDLDATPISYAVINAIQELKADNDNLRAELNALKKAIAK
ncbi:MAG: tail fiber domain-containing protein, partial [Alphaproteobacteria bacterium]